MLKTGRTFFPKFWETLDYDEKMRALEDSKCAGCGKVKKLVGSYYSQAACFDCSDENNQRSQDFRSNWDVAFLKYHQK